VRDGLLFFFFFLVHAPGCLRPTHCRVCNNTAIYTISGGEYENGEKAFQKDKILLPRKNAERENAEQLVALLDMVMSGVAQKKESREKTTTTASRRIIGADWEDFSLSPTRTDILFCCPKSDRMMNGWRKKKHKRKKAHT
jgi:hypothetical protein